MPRSKSRLDKRGQGQRIEVASTISLKTLTKLWERSQLTSSVGQTSGFVERLQQQTKSAEAALHGI